MTLLHPVVFDALIESSLRALLLAGGVGLLLLAWRVRPGAVRHAAWTAVLAAMLLLPVLPHWVPAIPLWLPAPAALSPRDDAPRQIAERQAPPAAQRPATSSTTAAVLATPPSAPARIPLEAITPRAPWRSWMLAIWVIGVVVSLTRLTHGWFLAARLSTRSRRSPIEDGVFESDLVVTPVTVGVVRPRIIFPACWTG